MPKSLPSHAQGLASRWAHHLASAGSALVVVLTLGACAHPGDVSAAPNGPTYYFSDCQQGAHASCVPGRNSASGTSPTSPKQDLNGFELNSLPAGAKLLFAQGGAWRGFHAFLDNSRATEAAPIVFDSYAPPWGGTAAPWLKSGGAERNAFIVGGMYNNNVVDGGYTIRNLKIDGEGTAQWGIWVHSQTRGVTLERLDVSGFKIGVHVQNMGTNGNTNFALRDSHIHDNIDMGFLGDAYGLVIERNRFVHNSASGTSRHHALYLQGKGRDGVIRNNQFIENSVNNGQCRGGNVTVHGQWDNVLIEGNTIEQQSSAMSCYGFSVNGGYPGAEWFRKFVIRGNTIVNLGGCSICVTSAPGIVIEDNLIVNDQTGYHVGISVGGNVASEDDKDTGAVVRRNTVYLARNASDSEGIRLIGGSDQQAVSNLLYLGAEGGGTRYCFRHGQRGAFSAFDGNVCHAAGRQGAWSETYRTLAAAQGAGFDKDGSSADPQFVAVPAKANAWGCELKATSAARQLKAPAGASGNCKR